MRFETAQHLRLGQTMKLAPRMIQSMEILQMPLAQLEERIEQELESNPTLELLDGDPTEPRSEDVIAPERETDEDRPLKLNERSADDDFARLDSFEETHPDAAENEFDDAPFHDRSQRMERQETDYSPWRGDGERDAKMEAMAAAPARGVSLTEQLRGQWALVDVDSVLRAPGELIISFLDEDGYLRTPLETIADRAPIGAPPPPQDGDTSSEDLSLFTQKPDPALMERALRAVQLFLEPPGVAARTPAECLLLQLEAMEDDAEDMGWTRKTFTDAHTIVEHHLDDISQNRLPRIAEKTGLSLDEIKNALSLLKRLSLSPARRLVEDENRPIVPDAIVEYDAEQDRYIAYLNDSRMPNLRINQEYARLAKDRGMEKRDREFIKTNLGNAQWLLEAVGQRRQTLLRVLTSVVEAQRDFFDYGPQALKPLPMTAVADQLGIHVATVSRAVAEKYIATPRGIVPLRKFFSGGVQARTEEGNEDLAWDAIKAALRELVNAEDKSKPLSDEALVEELKKRGIEIARRTVAKYRDQLEIPTARLRRKF
ncbi:MAG: RNA polymerase factor sigma-54 [Planctomycetes bacterium]|nr:RNA polymerase factor sigma-54 [Planctomycetota bacterium]